MAVCESASVWMCVCQLEGSVRVISVVRIKWLLCLTVGRERLQGGQRPHCIMAVCDMLLLLKRATISF